MNMVYDLENQVKMCIFVWTIEIGCGSQCLEPNEICHAMNQTRWTLIKQKVIKHVKP